MGGNAVRTMRRASDLSVRELARLAGVHPSGLSRWERGLQSPRRPTQKAITDALGEHLASIANAADVPG